MVEVSPNKNWQYYYAPNSMGNAQRRVIFLETMTILKLPTWFTFGFKKHIIKGKLESMKSHDYHV
jgi:hypothetical protein